MDSIYRCAFDEGHWSPLIEQLRGTLRAASVMIAFKDASGARGRSFSEAGYETAFLELYNSKFAAQSPLAKHYPTMTLNRIYDAYELVPADEFQRSAFFREYLVPQGIEFCSGGVFYRKDSSIGVIGVCHDRLNGPVDSERRELLGSLMPHLGRALVIHLERQTVRCRHSAMATAFEALPTGILMLDGSGRVIEANRAAKDVLERRDGISVDGNGILNLGSSALNRRVAEVIDGGLIEGIELVPMSQLMVPRTSEAPPYTLNVTHVPSQGEDLPIGSPRAVVFIADPESQFDSSPDILSAQYGLTPSESKLSWHLMQGVNLKDAAQELAVTMNTARTHLKRIFSKTGTHKQGQLVSLLLRGTTHLQL